MRQPRPGRNSPCPCGSGRKFKHCHGRAAGSAATVDPPAAKASARLLELAGPMLEEPDLDDDEFMSRLQLTMMSWNVAILEATAADTAKLRAKFRELGVETLIDELATKKARIFPDDMRQLLDVVVSKDPTGGRYVQVVSAS